MRLNVGCGTDIRPGWTNLDQARLPGVDVVHDLSSLPLPFADNEFSEICAKDVLEHLDYIPLLRELHRILRAGGSLDVQVPHFTSVSNFIDPTHRRQFSIRTFEFFVAGSEFGRDYYFDFQFAQLARRRLTFLGGPLIWNKLMSPLVNCHPKMQKYFELTFLCRLFPAESVVVRWSSSRSTDRGAVGSDATRRPCSQVFSDTAHTGSRRRPGLRDWVRLR